jgi:adenylylsulfate kinase
VLFGAPNIESILMNSKTSNLSLGPSQHGISRSERETKNGHRPAVIWMTGLSGSGKSTLSRALERALFDMGCHVVVMDGDALRGGVCRDLGFSLNDRAENIRRAAEIARLFVESGAIVITAFISPLRMDREGARSLFSPDDFFEIYCDASLHVCEERDVKGLYQKARLGLIDEFTGISSPYEIPTNPEFRARTSEQSVSVCTAMIIDGLKAKGVISDAGPSMLKRLGRS